MSRPATQDGDGRFTFPRVWVRSIRGCGKVVKKNSHAKHKIFGCWCPMRLSVVVCMQNQQTTIFLEVVSRFPSARRQEKFFSRRARFAHRCKGHITRTIFFLSHLIQLSDRQSFQTESHWRSPGTSSFNLLSIAAARGATSPSKNAGSGSAALARASAGKIAAISQ